MSEKQFQAAVVELATWFGWLVYFTLDSRGSPAGFPDLVLVRRGRLIFAELKADRGALSRAQRQWRDTLATVPGIEYYVWRPIDREQLERILR